MPSEDYKVAQSTCLSSRSIMDTMALVLSALVLLSDFSSGETRVHAAVNKNTTRSVWVRVFRNNL